MGFIGYLLKRDGKADQVVRIFLECREDFHPCDPAADPPGEPPLDIYYTYAVDVVFPLIMDG